LQHVIDFASAFRGAPKRSSTNELNTPDGPDGPDGPVGPDGSDTPTDAANTPSAPDAPTNGTNARSETHAAANKPNRLARAFAEAFPTRRSLTQLDGVDVHDSTRLETEGITDVPSLATADLVSIMVSTRLPVDRLVDWMDQAVLILLLDDDSNKELDLRVRRLRRIGIRTASGVLAANAGELGIGVKNSAAGIISSTLEGEASDKNTLAGLAAEIRREPAMLRILQWYQSELAAVDKSCPTITVSNNPVDGARRAIGSTPDDVAHSAVGHSSRIPALSGTVLSHESPRPNGD